MNAQAPQTEASPAVPDADRTVAPHDPALDDIARLAAQVCSVPVAFVALLQDTTIHLVGRFGISDLSLPPGSTPVETTVSAAGVYQLPDASHSSLYGDRGITIGETHYRFFAASPFHTPQHETVGCVAVMDRRAQHLTADQVDMLESLSSLTITHLESAHRATVSSPESSHAAAEDSLAAERNFVSTVLDTVGSMVVVQDAEGKIVRFNRACELISGYPSSTLVGQTPWESLVPAKDASVSRANFERIRDGGLPSEYEETWTVADKSLRCIRWSATTMTGENGIPSFVIATGIDITEQREAELQVQRLIRRSNSILQSVADGIIGLDLNGLITFVNPAGAKMLGYTPLEMIGADMHALIHYAHANGSPYLPEQRKITQPVRNSAPIRVDTEVFWRKDGTCFPVEYTASPQTDSTAPAKPGLRVAGTQHIGIVLTFSDISERNALAQMKDEFISTMSHELRTPLTALRGPLGLIASGALTPEKSQQMVRMAIDNTDRLIRLVSDVLDLERIAAGTDPIHPTVVSLETLMSACAMLLGEDASRAKVRLVVESNDVHVYADPDRIAQLLTNLVSNAIKFAPQTVPSEVRLIAYYGQQKEACLEISDQGRGIPAHMLETIFSRFKQIDASDAREKGGSGLGLAICRSIVQQHGGRIWATSHPGSGSTFHARLPSRPGTLLSQQTV